MTVHLNPYLTFTTNAREAMERYRDLFGAELTIRTFGEFGDPGSEVANLVMHARLETADGLTLMASDNPPGMMPSNPGDTVTVVLHGDDEPRLRGYFEGLAEGGTVEMALELQMWGDIYGRLKDRFGITWQVNVVKTPA
jgi:PhnB protein